MRGRPIILHVISVLGAYVVQSLHVYATDVYLTPLAAGYVLAVIIPKLFIEDVISVLFTYFKIFRVDVSKALQ